MKVLITGGAGTCGTALADLRMEKIFLDRRSCVPELTRESFLRGDLNNKEFLEDAIKGCSAIVHLAHIWSISEKSMAEVQYENLQTSLRVFHVAERHCIDRIIYASTAHVVGMYEVEHAPKIYEPENNFRVTGNTPPRPDSSYAMGKAICEIWGKTIAERGPRFYAIRVGAIGNESEDHPFASAEEGVRRKYWERRSAEYLQRVKRRKSKWQSRRDFTQMVQRCLEYDGPSFDVFYGVSKNSSGWMDLDYARVQLGYAPQDCSEDWDGPPEIHSREEFQSA